MTRVPFAHFAVVCLAAAPAAAQVPHLLGYQGRLMRSDGTAASGTAAVTFTVYDAATSGSALWSESQTLGLSDGYYSTFLGLVTPQADGLFDTSSRWLEVRVGSEALAPRQQLGAVPYAATAQSVAGGSANVASLKVAGQTVIDAAGRLAGPARYWAGSGISIDSSQTISLRGCSPGQVLVRDATAWQCAAANAGTVTGVNVSAPLSVTDAGTTPSIALSQAGTNSAGYLSSTDWNRFSAVASGDYAPGGDLGGTLSSAVVARLQTRPVAATTPELHQALKWNGAQWAPEADADSGGTLRSVTATAPLTAQANPADATDVQLSMQASDSTTSGYLSASDWSRFDARFDPTTACGGDLSGNIPSPTVVGLQSYPVSPDAPSIAGQVLYWDGGNWTPRTLQSGDVGTAFSQGSIPIVDSAGNFSENHAALSWDEGSGGLHVGTTEASNDFGTTLDVVGTASFRGLDGDPSKALVVDTDGSAAHRLYTSSTDGSSLDFAIGTSAETPQIYLSSSGNVGIGTSTPSGALDVAGDVLSAGSFNAQGGLLTGGAQRIDANGAMTDVTASADILTSGTLGVERGGTGASALAGGSVLFAGGTPTAISQDNANLYWDNTNKRLGVGTTTPQSRLVLAGSGGQVLTFLRDSEGIAANSLLGWIRFDGTDSSGSGASINSYASGEWTPGSTPGELRFHTTPAGEVMRMTSSGSVGIGTGAPQSPLTVTRNGPGFGTHGTLTLTNTSTSATAGSELRFQYGPGDVYYQSAIRGFASNYGNTNGGSLQFLTGDATGTSMLQPRMTIDQSGNVGIGTTSPAFNLVVASSAVSANIAVVDSGDSFTRRAQLGHSDTNGGNLILWNDAGDLNVSLSSYGSSHLNGGNVGIGTTVPAAALQVGNGSGSSSSGTVRLMGSSASHNTYGEVGCGGDNCWIDNSYSAGIELFIQYNGNVGLGTNSPGLRLDLGSTGDLHFGNGRSIQWGDLSNANRAMIYGYDDGTFKIAGTGTDRLAVAAGGNVGIGTTGPATALHVVSPNAVSGGGTVSTLLVEATSGNAALSIKSAGATQYAYQTFVQGTAGKYEMGVTGSSDAAGGGVFYLNPNVQSGANGSAFAIKAGNVGIGTNSPGAKLEVAGDLKLTGTGAGAWVTTGISGANGFAPSGRSTGYRRFGKTVCATFSFTRAAGNIGACQIGSGYPVPAAVPFFSAYCYNGGFVGCGVDIDGSGNLNVETSSASFYWVQGGVCYEASTP